MKVYFKNKATGVAYQVVKIDPPETKDRKIVLQGEHGQFVEPFTPDRFKKMGYALERVADDADATT